MERRADAMPGKAARLRLRTLTPKTGERTMPGGYIEVPSYSFGPSGSGGAATRGDAPKIEYAGADDAFVVSWLAEDQAPSDPSDGLLPMESLRPVDPSDPSDGLFPTETIRPTESLSIADAGADLFPPGQAGFSEFELLI
jgi:hypothetical protein